MEGGGEETKKYMDKSKGGVGREGGSKKGEDKGTLTSSDVPKLDSSIFVAVRTEKVRQQL